MQLPITLQIAIEKEIKSQGLGHLVEAREDLTQRYRQRAKSLMQTDAHRLAYIISRLPATYAAICKVFTAIKERAPELKIRSILDLGAGPGTAMWAAMECFPELETVTLMEKDAALASLGKRLADSAEHPAHQSASWNLIDLENAMDFPKHDLVIFSYSIGELAANKIPNLINIGWQAAEQLFVIIEPGTPIGFENIRSIRNRLIELGSHLIAPCPHQGHCPMSDGDWCHFAARVERSSIHRQLKSGKLGYEDEKFSYVAATKTAFSFPQSRVLRHPMPRSGHVILTLCTPQGVQKPIFSKRTPEIYKQARKLEWGSIFPPENSLS
jgi:ribosomal protein RSM22 (predicted rRNA methylase)